MWAREQGSANDYEQSAEIDFTASGAKSGAPESDTLEPDQSVDGSLPADGGSKWLRFSLSAPSAVTLTAEGTAGAFEVTLTDETGATLAKDAHAKSTSTLSRALPAGTYRVGVVSESGGPAVDYRLTLGISQGPPAKPR